MGAHTRSGLAQFIIAFMSTHSPVRTGSRAAAVYTLLTSRKINIELFWIAMVVILQSMEVFMSTLSTVPFVGLGLLVIGLAGFVAMAIVLGDHPGLFAVIICWYALAISCAGFALGRDSHRSRPFQSRLK